MAVHNEVVALFCIATHSSFRMGLLVSPAVLVSPPDSLASPATVVPAAAPVSAGRPPVEASPPEAPSVVGERRRSRTPCLTDLSQDVWGSDLIISPSGRHRHPAAPPSKALPRPQEFSACVTPVVS